MRYLINKTGGELYYKTRKGVHAIVENEILTEKELLNICLKYNIYYPYAKNWFDELNISKKNIYISFGVRFLKH